MPQFNRRQLLVAGVSAGVGLAAGPGASAAPGRSKEEPFGYCFNTSTIRGQEVGIVRAVEIASAAGYHGIEPWINELDKYVKDGGALADLRKRISDQGLTVESAIGFAKWIANDDAERHAGMEEAKRTMDLVKQIGGSRIAAPPVGGHDKPGPDLATAAARYRSLLELGEKMDVVPQVEVWGFSKSLSKLGETAYVALESRHPEACMLLDVYHLHKGGSGFTGLKLLSGTGLHVFHMNDYPSEPGQAEITDAHRVYPGDGVAPLKAILRDLEANGFRGMLSLELFNRDYWKQDPLSVARTGLDKMRAVVQARHG